MLILLICPFEILLAQIDYQKAIAGEWTQEGSRFHQTLGDGYGEIFDARYVRMTFQGNDLLVSYSPFEYKNISFEYSIRKDTLQYSSIKFILELQSDDLLRLRKVSDTLAIILHRVKPGQPLIYKVEGDTIYRASIGVAPQFNGNFAHVLLAGGFIDFSPTSKDRLIDVEFTLLANGKIVDVSIQSEHANWRNRLFKNTIIKNQASWLPPQINKKPVSTRVSFTVIQKSSRTLSRHAKAERYFASGIKLIETNPDLALQRITMSQFLEPQNAKYYFYRAFCYFKLLDADRMCKEIVKAQSICPFLPLNMVDYTMGFKVDCIAR